MKYVIGQKLWAACGRVCQKDTGEFCLDYYPKRVEVEQIVTGKNGYISFHTTNHKIIKEHSNLADYDLYLTEQEATQAAKAKAIDLAQKAIQDYKERIAESKKRIYELERAIRDNQD